MIKKIISSLSVLLLSFSVAFGAAQEAPSPDMFPPRKDRLDDSSQYAKMTRKVIISSFQATLRLAEKQSLPTSIRTSRRSFSIKAPLTQTDRMRRLRS
jgi:hypothetical protein